MFARDPIYFGNILLYYYDSMNTIQCPYCAEDIKQGAEVCKHCKKKVQFKLKELEKERIKQEKRDERVKKKWWKYINEFLDHKYIYTFTAIGVIIFFWSLNSAVKQDQAFSERYNAISEVNKTPGISCNHAKQEINKELSGVTFYNDCRVTTPWAFRDYVVGSFQGASYRCDVMYFDEGSHSDTKCTLLYFE